MLLSWPSPFGIDAERISEAAERVLVYGGRSGLE